MKHNKLIAIALILTLGLFLTIGCFGPFAEDEETGDNITEEQPEEGNGEGEEDIETYTLSVETIEGGSVNIDPDKEEYEEDTEVTITASPEEGWKFTEWTGSYNSEEKTLDLTITNNETLKANFEPVPSPNIGINLSEDNLFFQSTSKKSISYKVYNATHNNEYDIYIYERLFGPEGEQRWKDTYEIGEKSGHTTDEYLEYTLTFTPTEEYEKGTYTLNITIEDKISGKESSEDIEINIMSYTIKDEELGEQIKTNSTKVDYEDLFRNVDKYREDILYFKGEVAQVVPVEGWDNLYRLHVFTEKRNEEDPIYMEDDLYLYYQEPPRVLEDDIIEFWGVVTEEGTQRYETTGGEWRTIPELQALFLELENYSPETNEEEIEKENLKSSYAFTAGVSGFDDYQPRENVYRCPDSSPEVYVEAENLESHNSKYEVGSNLKIKHNGELIRNKTIFDSSYPAENPFYFTYNIKPPEEGWSNGDYNVDITLTDKTKGESVNSEGRGYFEVWKRDSSC